MEKKRKSAITAGLLALVILITGTFAWTSISQKALNEMAMVNNPGGRLHDDYYNEDVTSETSLANKDIYAENYGESPLFVRIKLTEYVGINSGPLVSGTQKDNKDTWLPYFASNSSNAPREYVTWVLGGEKVFLPTFNQDNQDKTTDVTGNAINDSGQYVGQTGTAVGDGTHDYFENNSDPVDGIVYFRNEEGNLDERPDSISPKPTLSPDAPDGATELGTGIITLTEWQRLGRPLGDFWVIDETDGWAYWANLLQPGKATSLLLTDINFEAPSFGQDFYYAIHVIGEFAIGSHLDNFIGVSDEAKELLDTVAGKVSYRLEVTPTEWTANRGDERDFSAQVIRTTGATEAVLENADIRWDLSVLTTRAAHTSSVDEDGVVTIGAGESNETLQLTVSATSADYSLSQNITITVLQPTIDIPATGTFTDPDTGTLWRVLTTDADGNTLIITENVYGYSTKYNGTGADNTVGIYALYENTNHLKPAMDAWYNNDSNVGSTIRSIALDYAYTNGNKGALGAGIEFDWNNNWSWNASHNLARAKTVAGATTTRGNGKVFPLSVSEANAYFTNNNGRIAKDTSGTVRQWWLRSPGCLSSNPASGVSTIGLVGYNYAMGAYRGFRPALWVRK